MNGVENKHSLEGIHQGPLGLILRNVGVEGAIALAGTSRKIREKVIKHEWWPKLIRDRWPQSCGGNYAYAVTRLNSEKALLDGRVRVIKFPTESPCCWRSRVVYVKDDPCYLRRSNEGWEMRNLRSGSRSQLKLPLSFSKATQLVSIQIQDTAHLVFAKDERWLCWNLAAEKAYANLKLNAPFLWGSNRDLMTTKVGEVEAVVGCWSNKLIVWMPELKKGFHYNMKPVVRHDRVYRGWFSCAKVINGLTGPVLIAGMFNLRVFEIEQGRCVERRSLKGHLDVVAAIDVIRIDDAVRVVTGSMDHTIRVWDLETATCLRILDQGAEALKLRVVARVGLSPIVLSAGRLVDSSPVVKVWDLESFECLGSFRRSFRVHAHGGRKRLGPRIRIRAA